MRRLFSQLQVIIATIMAIFLSIPLLASAQTETIAPVAELAEKVAPDSPPPPNGFNNGDGGDSQPPVSVQEARDFKRQFQDTAREAKQMLKQLGKTAGVEEFRNTLNEVIAQANDCVNKFSQASQEEKREVMNECWNLRLWDSINEIRDQFVPPKEVKNVLQEIKSQARDLQRLKKQAAKLEGAADIVALADNLLAQLEVFKNNITAAAGRDQRDAMQDYWDAQMWEETNKVRARVELPREIKQLQRELKAVQREAKSKSYLRAYAFFGVDADKVNNALLAKQTVIEQMTTLLSQGNAEEAFLLLQEEIHQGWHPGDLRHLLGMIRESYDRLRGIRDEDIREQIKTVMAPIIDTLNEGDIREARDAMSQFIEQMQKYERIFRPYYRGAREIDDRTVNALEKLEQLIQQKLQKGEKEQLAPPEERPELSSPPPEAVPPPPSAVEEVR